MRTFTCWLALILFSQFAAAAETQKIGTCFIAANGCHDESKSCKFIIPNVLDLDRTFKGNLPGIEIVPYTQNGSAYRLETLLLTDNGNSVSLRIYARGKGNWIANPLTKGGVCAGAAGGSYGVNVIAHYK